MIEIIYVQKKTRTKNKKDKQTNKQKLKITIKLITRGISYDFNQNNYMFWKLVNSFKMIK
jgi:hypothetical protein